MALSGYIAAIAMVCMLASQQVASQGLPALRATDLTNGTFRAQLYSGKKENCLANNVTYVRMLGSGPRWRIPHSLITMDGVRCGPLPVNSTDEKLDGDAWMDVFPFGLIATQGAAERERLIRPYVQFASPGPLRDYVIHLASEMGKERARREIILGYEGNRPRKCGSIVVPVESFVVFARNTNQTVSYGSLLRGQTARRLILRKGAPYHIMITPASNGVPRFCPYLLPADFNYRYPVRACFPADARARLRGGMEIPMARLRVGDEVEFVDDIGRRMHSPVIMFTHRDNRAMYHEFVRISMQTGETITLSPGHFVDDERVAAEIGVGDRMVIADGSYSLVIRVEHVRAQGLYNPQPASGRFIVNGVSVSAYTEAVPPVAAHAALLPFRVWRKVWGIKGNGVLGSLVRAATVMLEYLSRYNWEMLIWFMSQLEYFENQIHAVEIYSFRRGSLS